MKLPTIPTITLPPRVKKVLAWSGYPIFYLLCLGFFAYLTFPYDKVKDRLLADFEAQRPSGPSAQKIEIDSLGPYWFSGIRAKGLRLLVPRPPADGVLRPPTRIEFEQAHVRLSLLPLLIGRVTLGFGASAFGGNVDGTTRTTSEGRIVEASLEGIDFARADAIGDLFGGAPLAGVLRGQLELTIPESKLSKANGTLSLNVTDLSVGDGKTKLAGKLALPRLDVGPLEIAADIKSGIARIEKLNAQGQDLDLAGEGRITLRDSVSDSLADIYLRFRFSDAYRNKSDMTKSLFGSPGSNVPPLFELDPRVKGAKRPDGYYGWRMIGDIKDPRFDAAPSGAPPGAFAPPRTTRGATN